MDAAKVLNEEKINVKFVLKANINLIKNVKNVQKEQVNQCEEPETQDNVFRVQKEHTQSKKDRNFVFNAQLEIFAQQELFNLKLLKFQTNQHFNNQMFIMDNTIFMKEIQEF